jgi:hypothetical protein
MASCRRSAGRPGGGGNVEAAFRNLIESRELGELAEPFGDLLRRQYNLDRKEAQDVWTVSPAM